VEHPNHHAFNRCKKSSTLEALGFPGLEQTLGSRSRRRHGPANNHCIINRIAADRTPGRLNVGRKWLVNTREKAVPKRSTIPDRGVGSTWAAPRESYSPKTG